MSILIATLWFLVIFALFNVQVITQWCREVIRKQKEEITCLDRIYPSAKPMEVRLRDSVRFKERRIRLL